LDGARAFPRRNTVSGALVPSLDVGPHGHPLPRIPSPRRPGPAVAARRRRWNRRRGTARR
jgi:hypothetical protein